MANTGKKNFTGMPFGSNLYMVNPRYHNNFSTITYNGSTYPIKNILNLDKGNNAIEVEWDNNGTPTREWIRPTTDFWANEASKEPVYDADYAEEVPISTYVDTHIFPDYVDYDISRDAALERTNRVYSNYSSAKDNPLSNSQEALRNALRYLKDNVYDGIPAGISNCTLTTSQWINPLNPVNNASSIASNPTLYGYTPITEENAVPGDLVIAKVPNEDSYHTMLISGFANDDGVYKFGDTFYEYPKGEPLVTYSRGGHDPSFIRRDVPLSVYTANSDGHTENQYYRYNYPNEVFLPEVTINGREHAYGGPLVEMANSYEIGGPKKKYEPYYGIYGNVSPYIGEGAPILQYDVDSDEWYSDTWSDDSKRVKQERGWYKNAPQSFKDNYWMVVDPNGDKIKYVSPEKYKAGSDWYNGRSPIFGSGSWSDNSNSYANPFEEEKIIDGKVVWPEEGEFYIDGQQIYTDGEGGGYTEYEPFTAPNSYNEGGSLNTHKKWEDLSMKERGEMIRVAIRNGITNLSDIKSKYNEFAEGGNLYAKGNPLKKATLSPNVQYAMRYFMNKGLAPHQAAGLVGNLMRESSSNLNIGARNPNGGAFGIAQWLGARQKNLFARYGRTPSLQQQLDYVWHELNTTHKNGLRSLLASRDAAEAARNAFGWYEFSVGPEGAVADMNRHNQNGTWALNKGVQFASQLMGQPVPQIVNLPQQQIPQAPIGYVQEQPQGIIIPPLTPYNQEAFYNQDNASNNQALIDMMNSIQDQYNAYQEDVRRKELAQQEAAIKQQRMQGLSTLLSMFGSMNQDEGTSPFNYMAGMLSLMPNTSSRGGRLNKYGGNLYSGKDESTGYMRRMQNSSTGEIGNVININPEGTYNVEYSNGIMPMALQIPNVTILGKYNPRRMSPEEKEALMRVQRGLDERPIGGELKNNQYRTMPTNSEANTFADAWASQTAPTVGHLIAAGLKPLDLVTPSRYVGLLDSDNKNGFLHLFDDDNRGLFINDNPNGMFSKRYAEEHPYWAMAGNMAFDIPASVAAGYGIGKTIGEGTKLIRYGDKKARDYMRIWNENAIGEKLGIEVTEQNAWNPFKKFGAKKSGNVLEEDVLNTLNEAKAYKESEDYKRLVQSFIAETGEPDIPVKAFYNERNPQTPLIIFEKRPEGSYGGYTLASNKLSLDPNQMDATTPFHEGLHWQKVGNEPFVYYTNPDYNAWNRSFEGNYPEFIQKKLFNKLYSNGTLDALDRQNAAIKSLYKKKVDAVIKPDAPASSEMRKSDELVAHTFQTGKKLGLKPFQEYPGKEKALDIIKKARKEKGWLNDIKSTTDEDIENFWKLLTGNYLPVTIAGITTLGTAIRTK